MIDIHVTDFVSCDKHCLSLVAKLRKFRQTHSNCFYMRPYPLFECPIIQRFVRVSFEYSANKYKCLLGFPLLFLGVEPLAGPEVHDRVYPKGV